MAQNHPDGRLLPRLPGCLPPDTAEGRPLLPGAPESLLGRAPTHRVPNPAPVSGWWGSGSGYPPRFCPNLLLLLLVLTVKRLLKRPVVKSHIEKGRGSPSLTCLNVWDVVFKFLGSCPMHLPDSVRAQWASDEAARTWGASGARLVLRAN